MTRQEEIKYHLGLNLIALHENYRNEYPDYEFLSDEILRTMVSQGVVIKIDGELPNDGYLSNLKDLIGPSSPYYFKRYQDVGERQLKSYFALVGYVAVVPLTKEEI